MIITEDNNVIVNSEAPPLRNDAGVFIAIEDPFEEGKNLTDDDQIVKITKKTSVYQTSPQWDVILDREFKEL